tara:strand:- start:811 stop:1809 length:999 start_codon:yes stop_codon:yes gene_type:complete
MGFKISTLFFVLISLLGCKREFTNTYDTDFKIEYANNLNLSFSENKDAKYHLSWNKPEVSFSHYLIETTLNGRTFNYELPSNDEQFIIDWNDFDLLKFNVAAGDNISPQGVFVNNKPRGEIDFLSFNNISSTTSINPANIDLSVNFNTNGLRYLNCGDKQLTSEFIDDLTVVLFDNGDSIMEIENSYLNCDSILAIKSQISPGNNYQFKVHQSVNGVKIPVGQSSEFIMEEHGAFNLSPIQDAARNSRLSINWINKFEFIGSVDIYFQELIIQGLDFAKPILLSKNYPNNSSGLLNTFTFIVPSNLPTGRYRIVIKDGSSLNIGYSQLFNII